MSEYQYKVGDRVKSLSDTWASVPAGTTGMIVNADAFEAIWRNIGVDPFANPNWPQRPDFQLVGIMWDDEPDGWPHGEYAYSSAHEVELTD